MMDGFVIPASTPGSPDSVARRRKMAELMLVQSGQPERITHWSQGANKLAQALLGGINMRRADTQEAEGRNSANDMLVRALSGDMGVAPSQQDPQGTMIQAMNDPWQSPQGQQMLYQQWQRENTPPDPMAALQQQKLQLEIQQMQNPQQAKPTDDMREYEFAKSQGYQGTFQDYQQAMRKAGATNVNVGGGSDKQIFDETKARADAARSAYTGMSSLNEAQKALPGAITGVGAEAQLALQKIAALFGAGDTQKIVDTETFRAAIAPQVAAMLKATVGTTQISNADREFAERAAAGSISLDGQSIGRLINIMRAANSETIRGFNRDLESVYPEGQGFERERALFRVPNVPKTYSSPIGPERPNAQPAINNAPEPGQIKEPVVLDMDPARAQQQYDALQPGDVYLDPEGNIRRKK